jgi:hypothetical protein
MSESNYERERRIAQPYGFQPDELPQIGSPWQNVHTGDIERVKHVGPCANLDGETRIWVDSELERQWPSNGQSISEFARCWRPAESDPRP